MVLFHENYYYKFIILWKISSSSLMFGNNVTIIIGWMDKLYHFHESLRFLVYIIKKQMLQNESHIIYNFLSNEKTRYIFISQKKKSTRRWKGII